MVAGAARMSEEEEARSKFKLHLGNAFHLKSSRSTNFRFHYNYNYDYYFTSNAYLNFHIYHSQPTRLSLSPPLFLFTSSYLEMSLITLLKGTIN